MQRALNILGWIGTAIVFAAVAVRFLKPEWNQYAVYAAWAGLALVVLYTLGQWREIAAYFQKRNARYAAMASVSVLVVIGLLVAVNYLSNRRNKRWDLTSNKQYSLSDQSVKLLKGLDAPVKVRVFDKETEFERYRTRLGAYEYQSDKKLSVDYVDPDRHPLDAKQYDVQTYGTIVLEYKGRREKVASDSEQDVTSSLMKAINPQEKKVYFLSGHGEKDPASSDQRTGYSGVADALKADNYQFEKLVLAQTNMIPADATALVIAGPKTDLLQNEATLISEYLTKGGKLLVLLDPPDDIKKPAPMPQVEGLLRQWGINATQTVVVDVSGRTNDATAAVAAAYPQHPITERFELVTIFPLARAITPLTDNPQRAAQTFVQTSARSWAETNFAQLQDADALKPEPDKGDLPGPVSLAVAASAPVGGDEKPADKPADGEQPKKPETRVAAFGDSDFATNAVLGLQGNRDLFMNSLNWIAQQESQISIRPRDPADRRITLTENIRSALAWVTIVIIPLGVFGAGVFSWWRRR
jgi:gliding motility-associatede transport system auxiliary component